MYLYRLEKSNLIVRIKFACVHRTFRFEKSPGHWLSSAGINEANMHSNPKPEPAELVAIQSAILLSSLLARCRCSAARIDSSRLGPAALELNFRRSYWWFADWSVGRKHGRKSPHTIHIVAQWNGSWIRQAHYKMLSGRECCKKRTKTGSIVALRTDVWTRSSYKFEFEFELEFKLRVAVYSFPAQ